VGHGAAPEHPRGLPPPPAVPVEVEVRLYANLADHGPPGAREGAVRLALPAGATVADLLRWLRIPNELPCLLLVNGRDVEATARLSDGDVVSVLPPLAGG
jgi:molybdopterin converting factor small subunit